MDKRDWKLGEGASYYLRASREPWSKHYNMQDYVGMELPELTAAAFGLNNENKSLIGHSVGGIGALGFALKNPEKWQSVSALAPICNPFASKWGKPVGDLYFKNPAEEWKDHDPTLLIKAGKKHPCPILIDQGANDTFRSHELLLTENFLNAAQEKGQQVIFHLHENFDHFYWFVQSFIGEHIKYHAVYLTKSEQK